VIDLLPGEIIVDSFAGGGGASLGIELALGRSPDIAINHDAEAIAMHQANHPNTRHFCESVWDVSPRKATGGRPVGLAWFSPDCRHHSKAKGGKPVDKNIRGLAWVAVRWAAAVKPRMIIVENVEEFRFWGKLLPNNRPCPRSKGSEFRRWIGKLKTLGYHIEWRELKACDYGAPTTRKRLFIVARCDGQPIVWPEPTHGPGRELPYRTAAECIDWSIPCPSIFERERPLAENTLRRIARGLKRYVFDAPEPYLVSLAGKAKQYVVRIGHTGHGDSGKVRDIDEPLSTITSKAEHCLLAPTLIQTGYGERPGQAPRCLDLQQPLGTVVAGGAKHALVAAFIAKHYGGNESSSGGTPLTAPLDTITAVDHHSLVTAHIQRDFGNSVGSSIDEPMPTITGSGNGKAALVQAFLIKYFGTGGDLSLGEPLHTITSRDRFGLVAVARMHQLLTDIGMRMFASRELFRAQGFPDTYLIEVEHKGKILTKTAQIRMCGNSVSPPCAAALVLANVGARRALGPSLQAWEPGMVKSGEQLAMFDLAAIA